MSAPELVIRNARRLGAPVDLLLAGGRVLDCLHHDPKRSHEGATIIEAGGAVLLPSLIDAHVHLREPGFEYKEDIASGLTAAAFGGIGRVLCMANTRPVNDDASVTESILDTARKARPFGPFVHPIGALTKGLKGEALSPMADMAQAGCVAFSNDGVPVANTELFRRALEYAATVGRPVIDHCEDPDLFPGAGMNEGAVSSRLGLRGQPWVAEVLQVERDILLAEYLGVPIHLAHVSCRQSVERIAAAKAKGLAVTTETCPHYLFFTEEAVLGYDTAAKVNPPLRTKDDVQALRQALAEGLIDILATDHAPHAAHEKEVEFQDAPCGISGLDTALALTWKLVAAGQLTELEFETRWRHAPAAIFGLPACHLSPGDPADFVLFDPMAEWIVGSETMHSKSTNTPLLGKTLKGKVTAHYLAGRDVLA
jgi:dihydroorotase